MKCTSPWIRLFCIVAAVFWLTALALPVWEVRLGDGGWRIMRGIEVALTGPFAVFMFCPGWFANLALPFLLWLPRSGKHRYKLSVTSFLLALSAFMVTSVYDPVTSAEVVIRGPGFYLWLGSFFLALLAHSIACREVEPRWPHRVVVFFILVLLFAALHLIFPVHIGSVELAVRRGGNSSIKIALTPNTTQADLNHALQAATNKAKQEALRSKPTPASPDGTISDERKEEVATLIKNGAKFNIPADAHGLLRRAVLSSDLDFVRLLVAAGADVQTRDFNGTPILNLAKQSTHTPAGAEIYRFLADAGAKEAPEKPPPKPDIGQGIP